jgi:hypothetical protein
MVRTIHSKIDHLGTMQLLIVDLSTETLLSHGQRLKNMDKASKHDYQSVLHWIMANKPVGPGQYEWIFQPDDYVQLSQIDRFQSSILSSFLKVG